MNEDKIEIYGSWRGMADYQKDCLLLDIQIRLNGVPVSWGHVDIYSLALYSLNHKSKHYPNSAWSNFYPFSCSCGEAGCAGIWDGIHVKVRRNSVEWRAKKEDGYGFLGKSFFSFDKEHYMQALNKFFFWLMMEVDYDYKLCVDLGHYEGDEFTVNEFFEWLEKNK